MPLVSDGEAWDAAAAAFSIFEICGMNLGPWPDAALARKAFLFYDSNNAALKASYRLPFARIVDGALVAVREGLAHAEVALSACVELPSDVKEKARLVLDHYAGETLQA